MALEAGTRLGPYEIESLLGKGGMGEVYRARDTRLDRQVAIKVLPAELSQDPTFKKRFEREAKTISQLQHPNVCTLHDVGSEDGVDFLVMEYLEGETLENRLRKGGLPIDEVLRIGSEIAEAIEDAHRHGVVHRDLKPGNVMLTATGTKVLDFGLAKTTRVGVVDPDAATETVAQTLTREGRIVGTMPYMAPEQLQGSTADSRTDIWALGCILYEMATGDRPFRGRTQADLIGAILKDDLQPPSKKGSLASEQLDHIVKRCLHRDPERRWQTAKDVSNELGESLETGRSAPSSVDADRPSIAVLPFANMSADPEQEYFCDGMAEEVINALTQLEDLHVVARTSAFSFKGRDTDVRKIGGELGVSSVLEGSVRKAGDRLRVTAQLVNVADGYQLWSERYDRRLDDVFAVQDEIASSIVEKLRPQLLSGLTSPLAPRRTTDEKAYELYLRALFHEGKGMPAEMEEAIGLAERAISRDSDFALARARLSTMYTRVAINKWQSPAETFERAEVEARNALELDSTLADAHAALGYLYLYRDWSWSQAEHHCLEAIRLNPSSPLSYRIHFFTLVSTGRTQEALQAARRALHLDPLSADLNELLGLALGFERRYEEATSQYLHTLEMNPQGPSIRTRLFLAYQRRGMPEAALRWRQEQARFRGFPDYAERLGNVYEESGQAGLLSYLLDDQLDQYEQLGDFRQGLSWGSYNIAMLYAEIGNKDLAFEWLEKAREDHSSLMIFLKADAWESWGSLRSDPRFGALLESIGLEQ